MPSLYTSRIDDVSLSLSKNLISALAQSEILIPRSSEEEILIPACVNSETLISRSAAVAGTFLSACRDGTVVESSLKRLLLDRMEEGNGSREGSAEGSCRDGRSWKIGGGREVEKRRM